MTSIVCIHVRCIDPVTALLRWQGSAAIRKKRKCRDD